MVLRLGSNLLLGNKLVLLVELFKQFVVGIMWVIFGEVELEVVFFGDWLGLLGNVVWLLELFCKVMVYDVVVMCGLLDFMVLCIVCYDKGVYVKNML